MNYRSIVPLAAVGIALAVTGCGGDKSREDAGDLSNVCKDNVTQTAAQGSNCVDKSPKRVIANHNHFPNISTGCDGYGHRFYVTTRAAGNQVLVIDDASCPGGVSK